MKHALNYDRIDLVFDQYFKKSLKEGQDLVEEKVDSTYVNLGGYYYNIKQIIQELGSDIFVALPFFYPFTGCDIVSSFYGKGQCKAYDVWVKSKGRDDFFDVFVELGENPTDVISDHIDMLKRFVLQLYGSRHDTLRDAPLDKFKSPQITTWACYHQERKLYTNTFIVLLIKLGICGESVQKDQIFPTLSNGVEKQNLGEISNLY